MAQTLHGERHPGNRGAAVPPHRQAGLRYTPDAADPGAQEAVQSGSACGSVRQVRVGASVHARDANRKQQPERKHGELTASRSEATGLLSRARALGFVKCFQKPH